MSAWCDSCGGRIRLVEDGGHDPTAICIVCGRWPFCSECCVTAAYAGKDEPGYVCVPCYKDAKLVPGAPSEETP